MIQKTMQQIVAFSAFFFLVCGEAYALDGFERVQCGPDIPKALIGHHTSNERDAVTESRHVAIGLEDLGGFEVSDRLFSTSWLICGKEYDLILDDHSVIRDVLQFPPHSKSTPGFIGPCQVDGKEVSGTILAVLDDRSGAEMSAASLAWRIDEKNAKFVKISTDNLRCPRDGIFSLDSGK